MEFGKEKCPIFNNENWAKGSTENTKVQDQDTNKKEKR